MIQEDALNRFIMFFLQDLGHWDIFQYPIRSSNAEIENHPRGGRGRDSETGDMRFLLKLHPDRGCSLAINCYFRVSLLCANFHLFHRRTGASRRSHFAPSWDLHPKTDCDGTFASIIDEFNVRRECHIVPQVQPRCSPGEGWQRRL